MSSATKFTMTVCLRSHIDQIKGRFFKERIIWAKPKNLQSKAEWQKHVVASSGYLELGIRNFRKESQEPASTMPATN
jgi:hypothetical protein